MKRSFDAVQLSVSLTEVHKARRVFAYVLGGVAAAVLLAVCWPRMSHHSKSTAVSKFIVEPCFDLVIFHRSFGYRWLVALLSFSVLVISWLIHKKDVEELKTWHVPFIPHLVSCVVSEYDRGTNAVVVRSTIRQKIRRLACLPIPDEDALIFLTGSELVAEQLLESGEYFSRGAACFRLPL